MVELLTLNGKKLLIDLPSTNGRRMPQKEFKTLVHEMTGLHHSKYNLLHLITSNKLDGSPYSYSSENIDVNHDEITYGPGDSLMMVAMFGTSGDMML